MAYFFHDMAAYIGSLHTASKKTKTLFMSTSIGAVVNVLLNLLFIPIWGALGAAVTTLISYFVVWGIRIIDSKKYIIIPNTLKCNTL